MCRPLRLAPPKLPPATAAVACTRTRPPPANRPMQAVRGVLDSLTYNVCILLITCFVVFAPDLVALASGEGRCLGGGRGAQRGGVRGARGVERLDVALRG